MKTFEVDYSGHTIPYLADEITFEPGHVALWIVVDPELKRTVLKNGAVQWTTIGVKRRQLVIALDNEHVLAVREVSEQ